MVKAVTENVILKMNFKISYLVLSQVRKLFTSIAAQQQKNHYDSLGIAKGATQADVKSAYYELSKVYHPDRNQEHTSELREQHSQKFRDITEAYEVLGNVKTRKLYDKGFLGYTSSKTKEEDDPLHRFHKSRKTRMRPPPHDGRQPIYDFDEWSRMHYAEAVKRQQDVKKRRSVRAEERKMNAEFRHMEKIVWAVFVTLVIGTFIKNLYDSDFIRSIMRRQMKRNIRESNER